ncbi:phage terminase large subunit [Halalkalibacter krulwichiae]|uniref:Terminase-like family protein n=1 Tax=Halalkalibacter krulwichiae TaxID=199441 RepID=A0A1X9MBF3_9BACI|nr:phage terminase large subunit [Halalkalibacter krulwichiae]ARK30779.1 Terminase-like family protein [Halalkalibacter krulwichiae]
MSTLSTNEKQLLLTYLQKHFSPSEIEQLLISHKNNLIGQNGLRKKLAQIDAEYFALAYFPKVFWREFGEFQRELLLELDDLLHKEGQRLIYAVPRNHGKSTIVSFLTPLHLILFKRIRFILLLSASDDLAVALMNDIKAEVTSNEAIIEDFGELKSSEKWSAQEIWLKNDSCIMARGILGTLRGIKWKGLRPQLCLCDDMVTDGMVESESKNEKVKNLFKESVLNLGDSYSNYLLVGTTLSEDDLISDILDPDTTGWKKVRKQAVITFSDALDLWSHWESLYTNREDEDREETAFSYFNEHKEEMLKGTQVLWNERWTYYDLMKKKIDDGEISFWKELMNQPKSAGEYIFQKIQYWKSLPELNELDIVMYIDPAIKAGKRNDFSAITILGEHTKTKQKYILDGSMHKVLPDELFKIAAKKIHTFPVDRIGFETIQAQSYMKQKFEEALWKESLYLPIIGVHSKGKKESRIESLQPEVNSGDILFNSDNHTYNTQIKDYSSKSKFDDCPDSLFGAVQMLKGNKRIQTIDRKMLGI